MNDQLKFHTAIFGFSKKAVNEYISQMSRDAQLLRINKDAELAKAEETIKALTADNEAQFAQIREMEKEKALVSSAIIKAEQEAEKIKQSAAEEAERLKLAYERQLAGEKQAVQQAQAQLRQLRKTAIDVMSQFQRQLEVLCKSSEDDDNER